MRGCVLIGRVVFADDLAKPRSRRPGKPRAPRRKSRADQG